MGQGYRPSAWQVKRMLTEERVPAGSPMARFVGVADYEAAEGPVLRDLFADELSTRWKWAEAMADVDWSATARFGRIPAIGGVRAHRHRDVIALGVVRLVGRDGPGQGHGSARGTPGGGIAARRGNRIVDGYVALPGSSDLEADIYPSVWIRFADRDRGGLELRHGRGPHVYDDHDRAAQVGTVAHPEAEIRVRHAALARGRGVGQFAVLDIRHRCIFRNKRSVSYYVRSVSIVAIGDKFCDNC